MEDTHRYDFSDYEQTKVAYMMSKKPSGVGIAGLAIGSTALLGMIGAWIFAGVYANAKSKGNERAIDLLANNALSERAERVGQQPRFVDYVNVTTQANAGAGAVAGAQALATAEALALLTNGGSGRNGQVCPQPVALYQPAMPCSCPGGCNQ